MGLSTKLNTLLQNPLVETIISLIKKFKSSKSYWSVSYLVLLFTIREAIAWKFGSSIETFFQNQAKTSEYPFIWETLGFFLSTGGSIELVVLGVFLFSILSLVHVFVSKNNIDTKETITTATNEIKTTQDQHSQKLQEIENLIKLHGGDETAFLEKYFGKDYEIVLNNPITYHNFTTLLKTTQKTPDELLKEREELLNKIKNQSLESSIKTMVDKAFKELRYDDVRTLLDKFIKDNKTIYDDIIKAHYLKALSYMEEIKYHEARKEFEENIPIAIKDTSILFDYAKMYYHVGEYNKALELFNKTLTLQESTDPKNDSNLIDTYMYLANVWRQKGDYDNAIEFYNKMLTTIDSTHSDNDVSTANAYMGLGNAWSNKGDYDKAIEFYNKDLTITLATLGENHPSTAMTYGNLGNVWSDKDDYDKAIEFYNKAYVIFTSMLGESHPYTKRVKNNIKQVKEKLKSNPQ